MQKFTLTRIDPSSTVPSDVSGIMMAINGDPAQPQ